MKKTSIILAAFVLALGLTQCKKEQAPTTATEENGIRITLDLGSNSRAQVDPNNPQTNGEVSWAPVSFETNDTIYVGYKGSFVGKLGFNSNKFNGTLDGNLIENLGVDGESHLHFYLLGGKGFTPTPTSTGFTVDISDQTDRYPVIAYAASNEVFSTGTTTYTAKLKHKASIMKFNVTTPSNSAICITGMNNKVTVDFSKTGETDNGFSYSVNTDDEGLIKMPAKDTENSTWAIVLPQAALGAGSFGSAYTEDLTTLSNCYLGSRPSIIEITSNEYIVSGVETITMNTPKYIDLSLNPGHTAKNGQVLYGETSSPVSITAGATVTLDGVNIVGSYGNAGLTCNGNATFILEGSNTVKGGYSKAGIQAGPTGTTLTIRGSGSIIAEGGFDAAGIGSSSYGTCGNITINSGNVTANGGDNGAGIGSGSGEDDSYSTCGNITINGGTIIATGGSWGAGIGSGWYDNWEWEPSEVPNCGNILITGGNVTAKGTDYSAGIGTGSGLASCRDITITGGSGTAEGGDDAEHSIGRGDEGSCGTVTINGVVGEISTSPYSWSL